MEVGSVWNGWIIESFIGEGSFGKVYKIVKEQEFGRSFESALKAIRIPQSQSEFQSVLNEGMSEDSALEYYQSMMEDIVSECVLMSVLSGDSNIVKIEEYSVVPLQDSFGWDIFIRMELLEPFSDYQRNHLMCENDVVQIGINICMALEILQRYNIIRNDIKYGKYLCG